MNTTVLSIRVSTLLVVIPLLSACAGRTPDTVNTQNVLPGDPGPASAPTPTR